MSPPENIPPIDVVRRVRRNLGIAEHLNREGDGTLAMDNLPALVSDETAVEMWNFTLNRLNPERVHSLIIDYGRPRNHLHTTAEYEGIFVTAGLSRRSERPVWQYDPQPAFTSLLRIEQHVGREPLSFMRDWLNMCKTRTDYADRHVVPNDMVHFETILRESMPARLTVDSWIAVAALPALSFSLNLNPNLHHELCEWQPQFGEAGLRDNVRSGRPGLPFIGPAEPGRLIWWKPTGFDPDRPSAMRGSVETVLEDLRRFERSLVALARRIANQVAMKIVREYAFVQFREHLRPSLDRVQVERAVKEILGEEWFDLEFDTENRLRGWSVDEVLKPDGQMSEADVFNVFTGREQAPAGSQQGVQASEGPAVQNN